MNTKSITNKIALVVLILLVMVVLTSILMPTLSTVRKSNVQKNIEYAQTSRIIGGSVPIASDQFGYTGEAESFMK